MDGAALLAPADQTGIRQHVEMLHDRRQRYRERPRQFADRKPIGLPEPRDQRAPRRIGQRRKNAIEGFGSIVNH